MSNEQSILDEARKAASAAGDKVEQVGREMGGPAGEILEATPDFIGEVGGAIESGHNWMKTNAPTFYKYGLLFLGVPLAFAASKGLLSRLGDATGLGFLKNFGQNTGVMGFLQKAALLVGLFAAGNEGIKALVGDGGQKRQPVTPPSDQKDQEGPDAEPGEPGKEPTPQLENNQENPGVPVTSETAETLDAEELRNLYSASLDSQIRTELSELGVDKDVTDEVSDAVQAVVLAPANERFVHFVAGFGDEYGGYDAEDRNLGHKAIEAKVMAHLNVHLRDVENADEIRGTVTDIISNTDRYDLPGIEEEGPGTNGANGADRSVEESKLASSFTGAVAGDVQDPAVETPPVPGVEDETPGVRQTATLEA